MDKKRIDELKLFAKQKNRVTQSFMKSNSIAPGMMSIPPMLPSFAPFQMGKLPSTPTIDAGNLHPHLRGILGLPLDENIINIIKSVKVPTKGPDFPTLVRLDEDSKLDQSCPKCVGKGFLHESSAKHDKKPEEKCKKCIVCKGIFAIT